MVLLAKHYFKLITFVALLHYLYVSNAELSKEKYVKIIKKISFYSYSRYIFKFF